MVGLTFTERMSGPFAMGVDDPHEGARRGRRTRWTMTLHARVTIPDVGSFVGAESPTATMSGELELPGVRNPIAFDGGTFRLFPPDDSLLMLYELGFTSGGDEYLLAGTKCWRDRPLAHRVWSDTTTLQVRLHSGADSTAEVTGAGLLRIGVGDFARALTSIRAPAAETPVQFGRAVGAYGWLFARKLSGTYLPGAARLRR
jgi:hypothetical protein